MDYRKHFEEQLNVNLPKNFDVHHIDFNRENNDINNLVAVPKELHQQFHFYQKALKPLVDNFSINEKVFCTFFSGSGYCDYYIREFNKYFEPYMNIFNMMCDWVNYREYLLNNIPYNLKDLSYEEENE